MNPETIKNEILETNLAISRLLEVDKYIENLKSDGYALLGSLKEITNCLDENNVTVADTIQNSPSL